jgi:outer membrane protein assembly factor BamD
MFKELRYMMLSVLLLVMVGCAGMSDEDFLLESGNVEGLYAKGMEAFDKGKYVIAKRYFAHVERDYPAHKLAPEAQIMRAMSEFENTDYEEAIATIEAFAKQYPNHPRIDYMYFLKGASYYDQIVDYGRDQEKSRKSIEAFQELINRFPDSKYSRAAQFKIDYAYNSMAGQEMEIGRYYQKKMQLTAAANRFRHVVLKYERSVFIPEALYRLVEVYYALNIPSEAKTYAAILGHNYRDSEWYNKAYNFLRARKEKFPELKK